ncbi:hypothetical protein F5148DRAFT_1201769, partial [Russula earlei]
FLCPHQQPVGAPTYVHVSDSTTVTDLRELIKAKRSNYLARVDSADLEVWNCLEREMIMANETQSKDLIPRIEFSTNNDTVVRLNSRETLERIPREGHLLLVRVIIPQSPDPANDRVETKALRDSDNLREYNNIFIKVAKLGAFDRSDIDRNDIVPAPSVPEFVETFERKLESKPRVRLPPEMATENGPPEESTSEGQSHEGETAREAGVIEMAHIAYLRVNWEHFWSANLAGFDSEAIDRTRLLVEGAAVVRLANKFLDAFKNEESFVLIAIYIWPNAIASQYFMFQNQKDYHVR